MIHGKQEHVFFPGRSANFSGGAPPPAVLQDDVVNAIAKKHNKSPAQVVLRHQIQQGVVAIPKSVKQHRIKENFDIYDFSLSDAELVELDGLDKGSKARSFGFRFQAADDLDPTKLAEYPLIPRDEY